VGFKVQDNVHMVYHMCRNSDRARCLIFIFATI